MADDHGFTPDQRSAEIDQAGAIQQRDPEGLVVPQNPAQLAQRITPVHRLLLELRLQRRSFGCALGRRLQPPDGPRAVIRCDHSAVKPPTVLVDESDAVSIRACHVTLLLADSAHRDDDRPRALAPTAH